MIRTQFLWSLVHLAITKRMPRERVVIPKQTPLPYRKVDKKSVTSNASNISERTVKDKKATTHTGSSIRVEEKKRKTVFKAVLDSPFNINWLVLRETLSMK